MALDKIPTNADLEQFKPDSLKQTVREWFNLCTEKHYPRSQLLVALKKISHENLLKLHQSGLLKAFLAAQGKSTLRDDIHPLMEFQHALQNCDVVNAFDNIEKMLALLYLSHANNITLEQDKNQCLLQEAMFSSEGTPEERKQKMNELFDRRLALIKAKDSKLNRVDMSNIVEHVKGVLKVKLIENPSPKKKWPKKPLAVFEFDPKKLKQIEDFIKKDEYKDKYSFQAVKDKADEYVISKIEKGSDGAVKKQTDMFNVDAKQGKITLPQGKDATREDYEVVLLALMESLKNTKNAKIVMWAVSDKEKEKIEEAMENIFENDKTGELEKKFGDTYRATSNKDDYTKLKSGDESFWKNQPKKVVEAEEDEKDEEEDVEEKPEDPKGLKP